MAFKKLLAFLKKSTAEIEQPTEGTTKAIEPPATEYPAALGAEMMTMVVDASKNISLHENVHVRMKFDEAGELVTCEVEHLNILEASRGFSKPTIPASLIPSSPAVVLRQEFPLDDLKQSAITRLPPPAPTPPVSMKDFRICRILGQGGMGTVVLVSHNTTRQYFALKAIKKSILIDEDYLSVFTEQDTMRRLVGTPWTLQLKASFQDDNNFFLLTGFCCKGNLEKKIFKSKEGRISESDARKYSAQLVLAIEDLHSRQILHRDIKPANILLNAHDDVQLADFGLARNFGSAYTQPWAQESRWAPRDQFGVPIDCDGAFTPEKTHTMSRGGTWGYMSPEAIRGLPVSYPADVWGIGMCLYEMLMGKMPFDIAAEHSKRQISFLTLTMPVEFDKEVGLHEDVKDLIRKLLDKSPSKRPSLEQIKLHPWFQPIYWDAMTHECSKKQTIHWYSRKNEQPTKGALETEFGTPYVCSDDIPFPWFQWKQPGPLTAFLDGESAEDLPTYGTPGLIMDLTAPATPDSPRSQAHNSTPINPFVDGSFQDSSLTLTAVERTRSGSSEMKDSAKNSGLVRKLKTWLSRKSLVGKSDSRTALLE